MNVPKNLFYTRTHEWVEFTGENAARVGLTDFAQSSMGSVVFVNLPAAGDTVTAGESFGESESVKAVSDIMSPFSGVVAEVNEELPDAPEKINEAPYESWLIAVTDITAREDLMDAGEYEAFCGELQ